MIKVLRHGNTIAVTNPVTRQEQQMVNITFVEEGRSGGDAQMSGTSAFLSGLIGEEVGLSNLRIHTHPVLADQADKFPIGNEFPGHINRRLYSTPQLRQQKGVDARMVDGRPTYFKTWIGVQAEDDVDLRISNDVLAGSDPNAFFNSSVGTAETRVVSTNSQKGIQPANQAALKPEAVEARS